MDAQGELRGYILDGSSSTTWIEPSYKALLGSKALLPVMWEMFPNHDSLLPAFFDEPYGLERYVAKPMYGWEGAGIRIHEADGALLAARPERHAAGQECVYQQFVELPRFSGAATPFWGPGWWVSTPRASASVSPTTSSPTRTRGSCRIS